MPTTATRKIEFDYGHRVLGHGGKCRHLHGHHGVAEITVEASLDELGMVFDFGDVKKIIGSWIDEFLDHNLLLNSDDPQLLHLLSTEERKPYVFEKRNPTAEVIAEMLFHKCVELLPTHVRMVNVRVWETPNCHADYCT